ncbi:MAG: alpha/beta fold hydrolase [Elusimicrobiota bacterium]
MTSRFAAASLLLLACLLGCGRSRSAAQRESQETAVWKEPYLVAASSVSITACWRQEADYRCRTFGARKASGLVRYEIPTSTAVWRARALPGRRRALRFAVMGDEGLGGRHQQRVAKILAKSGAQIVLLAGDIVYGRDTDEGYADKFFRPYEPFLSRVPFYTALGNHDYGDAFFIRSWGEAHFQAEYHRIFHKPKYYSFDAGPAHFVSLDDNEAYCIGAAEPIGPGSAQARWLDGDLASSRARWKFVFLHVPLHTTTLFHGDNGYLRRVLEPIFRRRGVDVVFQGHDHFYERGRPIGGIVYLTVGTGGGKILLHWPERARTWLQKRIATYGMVLADVDRSRFSMKFIDENGKILDSWSESKPAAKKQPMPVSFKTADGWTIHALYHAPKPGMPAVVLVHGLGSSNDEWNDFSPFLWRLGVGTLALDLRGHGQSLQGPRGREDYSGFDSSGEWAKADRDILAAVSFLRRRKITQRRIALMGASIGANLVSRAAEKLKSAPWIALLSPGENYHGVFPADLSGRRVLCAASPPDAYAYATCLDLVGRVKGAAFLAARGGHGVQMFKDNRFTQALLSWIRSRLPRQSER